MPAKKTGTESANDDARKTRSSRLSADSPHFLESMEKSDEPHIQHTMKVANIWPYGGGVACSTPSSEELLSARPAEVGGGVRAGVHMKTNIYMLPSKSDWSIPQMAITGSRRILLIDWQPSK